MFLNYDVDISCTINFDKRLVFGIVCLILAHAVCVALSLFLDWQNEYNLLEIAQWTKSFTEYATFISINYSNVVFLSINIGYRWNWHEFHIDDTIIGRDSDTHATCEFEPFALFHEIRMRRWNFGSYRTLSGFDYGFSCITHSLSLCDKIHDQMIDKCQGWISI